MTALFEHSPWVEARADARPSSGDRHTDLMAVVATASDLSVEWVGSPDGAVIYVQDHGKPMKPTGLKGKLTVLNGAEKSQAELVVAALVTLSAKAITVRFTVK